MITIRSIFIFLTVFLFCFCASVSEIYAATIKAKSNSYADVSAAVSSASSGDTVVVPAGTGSVTWNSQLVITKGITLQGPGANNLTITGNYTAPSPSSYNLNSEDFLIAYAPAIPANREAFRLTGFSIDTDGKCLGLQLFNKSAYTLATVPNQIRIDHNTFDTDGQIVIHVKLMWGVIDNNTFNNCSKIANEDLSNINPWNSDICPIEYGSANYMYIEDNTFNMRSNTLAVGVGYSGRSVVRYNDFSYSSNANYAIFDIHNLDPQYFGGMGAEVYGNNVTQSTYPRRSCIYVDHRGGKLLFFYNQINGNTGVAQLRVRQEDPKNSQPASSCSQSYLVSDGYYFNNRHGSGNLELAEQDASDFAFSTCCGEIAENTDFFRYNASCTSSECSSGVGIGLAPPTGTCTTGVGYWKTDQSASNTTGMVGVNPATPISGTLYKCTSTNTWSAYYTPYTYPHPLTKPNPPSNLRIVAP